LLDHIILSAALQQTWPHTRDIFGKLFVEVFAKNQQHV